MTAARRKDFIKDLETMPSIPFDAHFPGSRHGFHFFQHQVRYGAVPGMAEVRALHHALVEAANFRWSLR
jgi:hypothetical protein